MPDKAEFSKLKFLQIRHPTVDPIHALWFRRKGSKLDLTRSFGLYAKNKT